jgi:hypothetical protein
MAKKDSGGMAANISQGGHYIPSSAPSLGKAKFQQVGTFTDEGDMNTIRPKGTSVNSKTGQLQNGE